MKKEIFALSAIVFLAGNGFSAEMNAGRVEIGGGAAISFQEDYFSLALSPYSMYFIIPNFSIGGSVLFAIMNSSVGSFDFSATSIGLGPRCAYYFDLNNGLFFPYAALGFEWMHTSYGGNSDGDSENDLQVPLEGGLRFFLNDFVVSDLGLRLTLSNDPVAFQLFVGFSMFLR
jgi:hypothetical protein